MKSEKQRIHLEKLRVLKLSSVSSLLGKKRPPFSKEWRENMSRAKKGKKIGRIVKYLNIECKHCKKIFEVYPSGIKRGRNQFCSRECYSVWQSENKRGENHTNWQGGISTINQFIRNSYEYKLWRMAVFKRDNFTCSECGEKKSVSGKLTADHIKPFSLYPELRFELSNGRTLCRDCHEKTDTWGGRIIKLKKELCQKNC